MAGSIAFLLPEYLAFSVHDLSIDPSNPLSLSQVHLTVKSPTSTNSTAVIYKCRLPLVTSRRNRVGTWGVPPGPPSAVRPRKGLRTNSISRKLPGIIAPYCECMIIKNNCRVKTSLLRHAIKAHCRDIPRKPRVLIWVVLLWRLLAEAQKQACHFRLKPTNRVLTVKEWSRRKVSHCGSHNKWTCQSLTAGSKEQTISKSSPKSTQYKHYLTSSVL